MQNWQNIGTEIGSFEAIATSDVGVTVRTGYDDSLPMPAKSVTVRKIAYTASVTFDRSGNPVESRIARADGKAAVSESAASVIQAAAKGVFGKYLEVEGESVFDIALQRNLTAQIADITGKMSDLSSRKITLEAELAEVSASLTE